jgi:tetratricopeptide (TPR) repeat protein
LDDPLSAPDRIATHVNRGILRALRREYAQSLADYDTAITLGPNEPETFLNKGLLLLRIRRRTAEAAEYLSMALSRKTKMPALAHYARGVAHEQLGQAGAAYRDYQQAATLAPTWHLPIRELRRFRMKS